MTEGRYFTIGRVISKAWHPAYPLLPWALASALLTVAGSWDFWTVDKPPDLVVLGLAAYEMMLGLIETAPSQTPLAQRARARK